MAKSVGGIRFGILLADLVKETETVSSAMFSGAFPLERDQHGLLFLDRNPSHFARILHYLRTGEMNVKGLSEGALADFQDEVEYYCIGSLMQRLGMNGSSAFFLLPRRSDSEGEVELSTDARTLTATNAYCFGSRPFVLCSRPFPSPSGLLCHSIRVASPHPSGTSSFLLGWCTVSSVPPDASHVNGDTSGIWTRCELHEGKVRIVPVTHVEKKSTNCTPQYQAGQVITSIYDPSARTIRFALHGRTDGGATFQHVHLPPSTARMAVCLDRDGDSVQLVRCVHQEEC